MKDTYQLAIAFTCIIFMIACIPGFGIVFGILGIALSSLVSSFIFSDAISLALPLNLVLALFFMMRYVKTEDEKKRSTQMALIAFFINTAFVSQYLEVVNYYVFPLLALGIGLLLILLDFIRHILLTS